MSVLQEKYIKTNFVTRRLLDGFFRGVGELLSGLEVRTVIELGCGEGVSTRRIAEMLPPGATLEASEYDERRVEEARRLNPDIPCRREDIYRLGRPDRAFDLVIVLEVLEHLDEPERALAEICRVAGRWVILSVPREPIWRLMNLARLKYVGSLGNTPGHIQHWSAGALRRLAGRWGKVRKCRTPLPWTMVLLEVGPEKEEGSR